MRERDTIYIFFWNILRDRQRERSNEKFDITLFLWFRFQQQLPPGHKTFSFKYTPRNCLNWILKVFYGLAGFIIQRCDQEVTIHIFIFLCVSFIIILKSILTKERHSLSLSLDICHAMMIRQGNLFEEKNENIAWMREREREMNISLRNFMIPN